MAFTGARGLVALASQVLALAVLLLLLTNVTTHGQTISTSQVSGWVADSTGLAVPGARITLSNVGTGASRTVLSGADGFFAVPDVPTGRYELRAESPGFRTYIQSGIDLQLGLSPKVNVTLQVGAQSEQVTVRANTTMVETHSVGVGQVIDEERIVDLPLNGRQVYQLVALAGAAVSGPPVSSRQYPSDAVFSVAGGQRTGTNFLLDGASHMDTDGNFGLPAPFPDAVAEFKVETGALAANYGNHPGGAVNVITKSGTNAFHGDVFEFVRNYAMNARNFFAPARDSLERHQFGGVWGGPIVKNAVHFFLGYQGTLTRSDPSTSTAFVATPAVLAGDFTAILSPACNGGRQITARAPFVGNQVSPLLLNPVAVKILSLIPGSHDPCGRIQYGVLSNSAEHQGIGRVDWQRTPNDAVFARWFVADYSLPPHYTDNLLTGNAVGLADRVQSGIAGHTWVINSSTVSSFRASFARSSVTRIGASNIPTLTQLGANVDSPIPRFTGLVSVAGYFSLGGIPGTFDNETVNLSEDLTMTRGAHQVSAGVNWIHARLTAAGPFQQNPRYTFNGSVTGNALTDFLIGAPTTFGQGNGQLANDRLNTPSLYLQDNWRAHRKVSVNLGLRWDPFLPQYNVDNVASVFDREKFDRGITSTVFTNAPAGVFFPGDSGFPGRSNTFGTTANFAPRLGIVYDPRARGLEAVRAGYGVFYDSNYTWLMQHVPLNPPWGETLSLNTPAGGLSDPWAGYPGGNPFPTPVPLPADFPFPLEGVYVFMPLRAHPPSTQQWNLSLEKQLRESWRVSANYLGNKTTHLWLSREINPAVFIPGTCAAGQYGLTTAGPCSSLANTNQRRVLYLANPAQGQRFGSVAMVDDGANASYHGLLLTAQRRSSRGFSVLSNYTWSHCVSDGDQVNSGDIANSYQDPNNRSADRGSCTTDRRHLFNTSLIVQSPRFVARALRLAASDWQLAAIVTASSGSPLNITVGSDNARRGEITVQDRPNLVGDPSVTKPTIQQWFNTAAFARPPVGSYGNLGRNALYGPGVWNVDASLSRLFPLRKGTRLEFRIEAFNVFNHTRLGNPGTSLGSANTFGRITTALDPRIMQLAAKIVF